MKPHGMPHQPSASDSSVHGKPFTKALSPRRIKYGSVLRLKLSTMTEIQYWKMTILAPLWISRASWASDRFSAPRTLISTSRPELITAEIDAKRRRAKSVDVRDSSVG